MQPSVNAEWHIPHHASSKGTSFGERANSFTIPRLTSVDSDDEGHSSDSWERDDLVLDKSIRLATSVCKSIGRCARRSGTHFEPPESLLHVESCRVAVAAYFVSLLTRDYRFLYVVLVVAMGHVLVVVLKWLNFYMEDEDLQICISSWGKIGSEAKVESGFWLSETHRPGWGTAVSIVARYTYASSAAERIERKTQKKEKRLGYRILDKCEDLFPNVSGERLANWKEKIMPGER
mmetsp:Transcript_13930/g.38520  ORF Transcript_13930/g.38520 Transcript_13930/m.38520 type:complete len:234 (-) Transcript_13930:206-907(-)